MSSISCASTSYVDIEANRISFPLVSAASVRNIIRLFAVALGGALLAACAQSSVVTRNSEFRSTRQQASLPHNRTASFLTHRRVAVARNHAPLAAPNNAGGTHTA